MVFNAEKGTALELDDFRVDALRLIRDTASEMNR